MGTRVLPTNPQELASRIEAAELRPTATAGDVEGLVARALRLGLRGVCVNPCYVARAASCRGPSNLTVVAVVGFPLGANTTSTKLKEAEDAVANGAHELDAVVNLGWFLGGEWAKCREELAQLVEISHPRRVKAILEVGYLTDSAIRDLCALVIDAGVYAVKTSTGFGPPGATVEKVRAIRQAVGAEYPIKAAGGIRTWGQAMALLEAGATLIGTSAPEAVLSAGSEE